MRIHKLLDLVEENKFIDCTSASKKKLVNDLKNLKDLLTDTPKLGEIENGIRLEAGKISFSGLQSDKITNTVLDIQGSIFNLIVEINRSNRKCDDY